MSEWNNKLDALRALDKRIETVDSQLSLMKATRAMIAEILSAESAGTKLEDESLNLLKSIMFPDHNYFR